MQNTVSEYHNAGDSGNPVFTYPEPAPDLYWSVLGPMARLPVTVFPDVKAQRKEELRLPLAELASWIGERDANSKHALPLLKLATFGDTRSEGNSLRWDNNVLAVTGIEGDYDGEAVSPEAARDRLAQAGVEGLVYTTPSHTPERPRWRVLCLFCCPLHPSERARMVDRLNGVLGGVLSRESWTLSQSFYAGRIQSVPFSIYPTPGKRIDEMTELDAGAIGEPRAAERAGEAEPAGKCGRPFDVIRDALLAIPNDGERECENDREWWLRMIAAVHLESDGGPEGLELAHEWSDRWPGNDPAKVDAAWQSFRRKAGTMATGGIIMKEAKACGWQDPTIADEFDDDFTLDEDGVIRAFTACHKDDLRFDHHAESWLRFDGNVWRREETKLAHHYARELATGMAEHDTKAKALRKVRFWEAVERGARTAREFVATAADWNRDPWLLGTPDGTVDLRTGELRPGEPGEHISRLAAVAPIPLNRFDPVRDCRRWLAFLNEALGEDADAIRFLQQWGGYCLTGVTREQALVFVYGPGGSGKSTAVNTLADVLGEYAINVATSTLTAAKHDAHLEELARLDGARLAWASETEKGRAWAENRIKSLTGGDRITARFMRQNSFEFTPQLKLMIVGNNAPSLSSVDEAVKRRFIILPFTHPPKVKDEHLPGKLRAEWPGILSWLIVGCLDWQANGLIRPELARLATESYFAEQDIFAQWVEECCVTGADEADTTDALWNSWTRFANARGEPHGSRTRTFPETLSQRGFVCIKDKHGIRGRGYRGIRVDRDAIAKDFDDG